MGTGSFDGLTAASRARGAIALLAIGAAGLACTLTAPLDHLQGEDDATSGAGGAPTSTASTTTASTSDGSGAQGAGAGGAGVTATSSSTSTGQGGEGSCGYDCGDSQCDGDVCAPIVLATGRDGPFDIVVGGEDVFWTELGGQTHVVRCGARFCEGGPEELTNGGNPYAITWSNQHPPGSPWLFWTRRPDLGVVAFDLTKGLVFEVLGADAGSGTSIALDGDYLVWTDYDAGRVVRCSIDALPCTGLDVVADTGGNPYAVLSYSGFFLYWTDSLLGTIHQCNAGDCAPTETPVATDQMQPHGIALSGEVLFWTDVDAGTVMRCEVPDCPGGPVIVAGGQDEPADVDADETGVYWINQGTGDLLWCGPPGCLDGPKVLGRSSPGIGRIVLDDDQIFWSQNADGRVVRVAKPPAPE